MLVESATGCLCCDVHPLGLLARQRTPTPKKNEQQQRYDAASLTATEMTYARGVCYQVSLF